MNKTSPGVIPQPLSLSWNEGSFTLDERTRLVAPEEAAGVADYLAGLLRRPTGLPLPVEIKAADTSIGRETIHFTRSDAETDPTGEGYLLEVSARSIEIRADGGAGWFYGVQTLRQLLPAAVEDDDTDPELVWEVPAVVIEDAPRFSWRGLHLDVGRHMFPVAFIKKYLDLMALQKLNVFHWHLTDDQGWRIEIKKYPKLTEVGSRRAATPIPANRGQLDGRPYGGYYTQEEIKEVVDYAATRFITVVPEVEMPGHAVAALTSYPHLGCVGRGYEVRTRWGIAEDVFCAGNEQTYAFLVDVLSEVLELFPSEFIHIGGDECPKVRWQSCPKCQDAIAREGLADEFELQSYFVRRIEKFLNDNGRRLLGWDEILEGGLAPNATVMSWRGATGGIEAAIAGHDVVMTPNTHCYFDYYQSEDRENEPPAIGNYLPLEQVYSFDPVAGIPIGQAHHVLGGQGNLWTEYIPTEELLEYMAYPRTTALAETVWSDPPGRAYDEFLGRLQRFLKRLDRLGVTYRNPFAK